MKVWGTNNAPLVIYFDGSDLCKLDHGTSAQKRGGGGKKKKKKKKEDFGVN